MKYYKVRSLKTDEGIVSDFEIVTSANSEWFKVTLKDGKGSITATPDHLWELVDRKTSEIRLEDTEFIYNNLPYLEKDYIIGIKKIKKKKKEKKFFCYRINTERKLFKVFPKQTIFEKIEHFIKTGEFRSSVFVHNCQGRIGCGRLQNTASMMAFGSTIGTSVSGSIQGAGMFMANGKIFNTQYYFEKTEWITKWYDRLGYDKKGFRKIDVKNEGTQEEDESIDIDDIFNGQKETVKFEVEDLSAEVLKGDKQKFE